MTFFGDKAICNFRELVPKKPKAAWQFRTGPTMKSLPVLKDAFLDIDGHTLCPDGDNSPPEFVILLRDTVALWLFAALSTCCFGSGDVSSSHLSESWLTGYFLAFSRIILVFIAFVQHQTCSVMSLPCVLEGRDLLPPAEAVLTPG